MPPASSSGAAREPTVRRCVSGAPLRPEHLARLDPGAILRTESDSVVALRSDAARYFAGALGGAKQIVVAAALGSTAPGDETLLGDLRTRLAPVAARAGLPSSWSDVLGVGPSIRAWSLETFEVELTLLDGGAAIRLFLGAALLAVLGASYPAYRATRLDPLRRSSAEACQGAGPAPRLIRGCGLARRGGRHEAPAPPAEAQRSRQRLAPPSGARSRPTRRRGRRHRRLRGVRP